MRVRPDIEIRLPYESIADLKTVSLGYVRQDKLKDRLHREIIDRDYHLSAAMYCDVAGLINSPDLREQRPRLPLQLWWMLPHAAGAGSQKNTAGHCARLKKPWRQATGPAPITEAFTDDLNDYDTRRLEALDAE